MSCIKEFTCTRTFRDGDLYWNTANYQYILRGWKWPNHYFNLCNYFMKLYYRSNIVKKKFLKEWKCFDYNIHVLLSTSIPTGVHTPKFSEGKKNHLIFTPQWKQQWKKLQCGTFHSRLTGVLFQLLIEAWTYISF